MPTNQYEMPRFGSNTPTVHGWCMEAVQEGAAWLAQQKPSAEWASVLALLGPGDGSSDPTGLSGTQYNKLRRIGVEIVAALSNFRHAGEFKPLWDRNLYDRAHQLSALDENWWRSTFAHEQIRSALQYGVGMGTAYLYETWDKDFHGPFRGDIRLETFAPSDVTFVQLPKDHDIQRAYAVILKYELPINLARAIYYPINPGFAAALTPDQDSPGWLQKGLDKVQQFVSPALRVRGTMGGRDNNTSFPTVDIFHMYIMDRTVNDGPQALQMGTPGTNWSYTVPALGSPIQLPLNNDQGQPMTVAAGPQHTLLFPLRRLTVFSRTSVASDGSSPWWHGQVPLARLRYNDWAWEPLGASIVADGRTMQEGIAGLMRGMEDSAAARMDPPIVYDSQVVSSTWAKSINPRMAGVRAEANLQVGKPFELPIPPQYYDIPGFIPEFMNAQEQRIDYVTGVQDLVAIAKAKQVPGADTLEKLMEMAGPLVQDRVRALEKPLFQLGEWRKAYFMQFYTRPRLLTITGPTGKDEEIQYQPDKLIPIGAVDESSAARNNRIRGYISDFTYKITESGINEIHRMTNKLFYLQLMKLGFPLDWWTFAEIAQIPNFGPEPEGTHTVMERWVAQQRIQAELQGSIAAEAQMAAGGAAGAGAGGGDPNAEGGGDGNQPPPGEPGQSGPGRPQSFQKAPHIEQKDGGTRSTIATS